MPKIRIRDLELYYELEGDGPETIVFLNGIGMSAPMWKPMVDHFAPRYRCLSHDFRGQMLSDKPAGRYSMEMHVEDTLALLDALGIAKAHLVGTSYGSEVAQILACTAPERAASLNVITGVSETDALLRAAVDSWGYCARSGDGIAFYKSLLPWSYSPAFLADHQATLRARGEEFAHVPREFLTAFGQLADAFLELDCTARLKDIRCPTMIVAAELDIIKPPRFSEIIRREIRHAEFHVIPGAGHAVVVEDPQALNRLLDDFLRRLGR